MGVSTTPDAFLKKMAKFSFAVVEENTKTLEEVVKEFQVLYAGNLGKFRHMGNFGKTGKKPGRGVTVRAWDETGERAGGGGAYVVGRGQGSGFAAAYLEARPKGPARIAEEGAQPHFQGITKGKLALKSTGKTGAIARRQFKRKGAVRGAQGKIIKYPDGNYVRGPVSHPGTRSSATHAWRRTRATIANRAFARYTYRQNGAMQRSFN